MFYLQTRKINIRLSEQLYSRILFVKTSSEMIMLYYVFFLHLDQIFFHPCGFIYYCGRISITIIGNKREKKKKKKKKYFINHVSYFISKKTSVRERVLMAGIAKLFNGRIHDKTYREVNLYDGDYRGHIFGLYFSADWCPPCRAFTPVLTELYQNIHPEKKVKVIFISSDHDEQSFHQY